MKPSLKHAAVLLPLVLGLPVLGPIPATADPVIGTFIVRTASADTGPAHGITADHVFRHTVTGFSAALTESQLKALRSDPDVVAIEPDRTVRLDPELTARQSPVGQWGLDRIDQRTLPLDNAYHYTATGRGVTAYIISTGITPSHPEFGGRASVGYDATGGNGLDCNGFGTWISGIVGSHTFGVAKEVTLRGVKVLGCGAGGTIAAVIAGLDWVAANSPGPSVAVLPLSGTASSILNAAVDRLSLSGVFVAVPSGDNSANACQFSPASAREAFVVSAVRSSDVPTPWTNFGTCVDMCGPGESITSIWLQPGQFNTMSTSGASAAHATGIAAMYKHAFGETPSRTIDAWLKSVGTPLPRCLLLHTNLI